MRGQLPAFWFNLKASFWAYRFIIPFRLLNVPRAIVAVMLQSPRDGCHDLGKWTTTLCQTTKSADCECLRHHRVEIPLPESFCVAEERQCLSNPLVEYRWSHIDRLQVALIKA